MIYLFQLAYQLDRQSFKILDISSLGAVVRVGVCGISGDVIAECYHPY